MCIFGCFCQKENNLIRRIKKNLHLIYIVQNPQQLAQGTQENRENPNNHMIPFDQALW